MKTRRYLLWFDDVIAPCSIIVVTAAVIPSVPLTAPFTGHTRYTPENTHTHTTYSGCVCFMYVYMCVCVCLLVILRCVLVLLDRCSTVVEVIISGRHRDVVVHQNSDWDGHVV